MDIPNIIFSTRNIDFQTKKLLAKKKIEDLGIEHSKKIYNLLNIDNYLSEKYKIHIIDEDEEDRLFLIHYVYSGEDINHVRGIVLHLTNEGEYVIIAEGFPHTEDMIVEEIEENEIVFDDSTKIAEVFEGTVLRVFKGPVTGKWFLSTHKKLDGRRSRWSGPTFGDMFEELWTIDKSFQDSADEYLSDKYCYIFLLTHPENKLVCDIVPKLTLIGRYMKTENSLLYESENYSLEKEHPNVHIQKLVNREDYGIKTKVDLMEFVRNISWKQSTGVFIYKNGGTGFQDYFKLTNNGYMKKRVLRGNEPNLKLRYLEFKVEGHEYLPEFMELFSDKTQLFDEVEKDLKNVLVYLKRLYNRRYKNREYCIFPQEEHIVIENTRKKYDKKLDIQENIQKTLMNSTPRQINTIIKNMKQELKKE